MKRCAITTILAVLILGHSASIFADEWSVAARRITQLLTIDGYGVLRIYLDAGVGVNPANCENNSGTPIDIQLNVPSRSPEEQQLMLNTVYLAYMTNRNIRFRISDSTCSSVGTSSSLPTVVGIWAQN